MPSTTSMKTRVALVSVSDRTGLLVLAKALKQAHFELLATSGTASWLAQHNLHSKGISALTKFPEIAGGRVKTLHPAVYAGILCDRSQKSQLAELEAHQFPLIDLVVANLYPFEKIVGARSSKKQAIDNLDIGGVSLLRAAAKNHDYVAVLCDPGDYQTVAAELKSKKGLSADLRLTLAQKAFEYTARYDRAIADYFGGKTSRSFDYSEAHELRYGENPHQKSTLFLRPNAAEQALTKPLQGKPMSHNNVLDVLAATTSLSNVATTNVVVSLVKHGQPCGVATGKSCHQALKMAWEGDPISAYGSIGASSHALDGRAASFISNQFMEVFAAPRFSPKAREQLRKKKNLRLIEWPQSAGERKTEAKMFGEALLEQDVNSSLAERFEVFGSKPTQKEKALYLFAYAVVKPMKSNAVCICYEYESGFFMCVGAGTGQTNRVEALTKLAIPRATSTLVRLLGEQRSQAALKQCVVASDGFFPFADSVVEAGKVGLRKFIQPGGSVRDAEILKACDNLGATMVFTGTRHFAH